MKRTMTGLCLILFFILLVVALDLWFMTRYVGGLDHRLDLLKQTENQIDRKTAAYELDGFFKDNSFLAHRFIPTDRLDELEMLLHKMNSYISTDDAHEIDATIEEFRARIHLLYSTSFYHWYQPFEFRIE